LLMSHGFNDWNVMPEHSYRIYKKAVEMGIPSQLYYHQDGHGGPPPFSMMNRWFTKYLHGINNGVENDAKVWIVRENDSHEKPTAYTAYPNPDALAVQFYLKGNAPGIGELNLTKADNQGKETLVDNFSFEGATLAQAELTNHRLIFVTPELKEDLHLSGTPEITIRLAASKPAANLSVWLVSLPWSLAKNAKITSNIITRGWADPQNHSSLRNGKPLKLGKFYTISFPLQPDDQIIPKGQKIGLMIFSSDKEFTIWPDPGTKLIVDLEKTSLELPIVGGKEALIRSLIKP